MAATATFTHRTTESETAPPGRLTGPRRLWVMLLASVLAVLFAGSITGVELADRASTASHTDQAVEALYTEVQDLSYNLADANATASTALLIGPVTPAAFTARFGSDVTQAEDLLSSASQRVAGDPQASAQLQMLAEQIPVYSQWIGEALANNRFGYPVAGGYLREASVMLTTKMLPETDAVIGEEHAAMDSGLSSSSSTAWGALGACVLAIGVLWTVAAKLSARTKRRFNLGVLAALAVVAALFVWTLASAGESSAAASAASGDEAVVVGVQNSSSQLALVEAYVALQQIDRGEDNGADAGSANYAILGVTNGANLPGGTAFTAAQSVTTDASALATCVRDPISEATNGSYQQAITTMIGSAQQNGTGGCEKKATTLRTDLVSVYNQAQQQYDADMGRVSSAYNGSAALLLALAAGLLGAAAAAWGINRRLAEYR